MPVRGKTAGNRGKGSRWCARKLRLALYRRDRWRCHWCKTRVACGKSFRRLHRALATLDHLLPRSQGGDHSPGNLVTACMRCNRQRGDERVIAAATSNETACIPDSDTTIATCAPLLE